MEPLDLAEEIHKICIDNPTGIGISGKHDLTLHSLTTAVYVKVINEAKLQVTPKQVVVAILEASGWDLEGSWPGHPHPALVIELLTAQ